MPYHTFAVSHIYFIIQPLHKKVNRHNLIVFCRINARLYAFYIKRPPERRSFRLSINLLIIKNGVAGAPVKSPFPGERGQGDRDNKSEVNFKNRLFLQAERPPERRSCCFMLLVGLGFILVVVMQHSCSFMRFLFNVHL